MKKTLLMLTNNAEEAPFLYSQLLDIYEGNKIFEEHYVFCGGTQKNILKGYAKVLNNGLGKPKGLSFVYYYIQIIRFLHSKKDTEITIHIRGFVSAILYYLIPKLGLRKIKYVYDPRGAFLIEKKESKNAKIIQWLKPIEKRIIANALFTIVTTKRFKSLFIKEYGFEHKYLVCYNSSSFKYKQVLKNTILEVSELKLCYMGSVNYHHDLDEIYRLISYLVKLFNDKKIILYFYTSKRHHNLVKQKLSNIPNLECIIDVIHYTKMEQALEKMDICISVVRPTKSTKIASPIKVSDYIMLNKIIILNKCIGDFDEFYIENNSALLYEFEKDIDFTLNDILNLNPSKNRHLAENYLNKNANKEKILTLLTKQL